jgi:GNAT superfamily N-acetyltransferase
MEPGGLGRLLTPDWTPGPPEVLMTAALRPAPMPVAGDCRITVDRAGGITCAQVITRGGSVVARGQAAVTGETGLSGQAGTAPGHWRRGLGSAIMAALTTAAIDLGAATGIPGATVQGRALYETLDWRAAGPLSSFAYKRPRTIAGQERHASKLSLLLIEQDIATTKVHSRQIRFTGTLTVSELIPGTPRGAIYAS